VNALTNVNIYAAAFLIPISVVFYTAHGGLMACFIASWSPVAVIYIAMLIFIWKVYAGPSDLGSTDKVHACVLVYISSKQLWHAQRTRIRLATTTSQCTQTQK